MIHCSWNYRSQAKKNIQLSQKFWLFLAWIQFFMLLGLYAKGILFAGLGLLLCYGVYVYTQYLAFARNDIGHVLVESSAQAELQAQWPFKLSIEQAFLPSARVIFEFAPHPSLQFVGQKKWAFKKGQNDVEWMGWAKKLGTFKAPDLSARLEDDKGLFYQTIELNCEEKFDVLPNSQSDDLDEVLQLLQADPNAMVWKNRHIFVRKSDLVYGARDYRPGDPLKLIDAKKTSRFLRPMIKTFEQDETQHLEIILDVGRSMIGSIEASEKIDFYALLAYQLVRYTTYFKDSYSFHTLHQSIESLIHKSYHAEDFLALYRQGSMHAQSNDANLDSAVRHIQNLSKPSIVFLLVDMLKPSMHDAILKRLPYIRKKHKLIVLHVVEEKYNVKALVKAQAESSQDLNHKDYAQLVYALSLEERKQHLMAQLTNSNLSVVGLPASHAVSVVRELYRQIRG